MRKRTASRPPIGLKYLASHMSGLHDDRKRLNEIQAAYDNLSLLGQLLCSGTDISRMREDFNALAETLLDQLAREHQKKAEQNLGACARIAIDILTRNLFERTADIGFLATDEEVCAFAEAVESDPEVRADMFRQFKLQSRFTEYVDKYSVYHNIILLAPSGDVLIQLDGNNPTTHSNDTLIGAALTTSEPYIEVFRPTDLLPGEASPLVYAYRVMSADGSHPVGVLCLCFKFQDECQRIFQSLVSEDDWTVVTLLDAESRVIASSDLNQFPLGARLETVADEKCRVVRFAGREYLANTHAPQGYQGYRGPGWVGHALAPLNHAFEMAEAHELQHVPESLLDCVLATANLFGPELKAIPLNAASIQNELNRAVWNGYVWLVRDQEAAQNAAFAKVLLREIGSTGVRTRNVFSESITNLYKTVVSTALLDCATQSALAIDIMDRNLYERANDCRWWALTRTFREELAHPDLQDGAQRKRLTEVLRYINGLYTVYSNLILFDQQGRVIATSNPAYGDWLGRPLGEQIIRSTLSLKETSSYAVSSFTNSGLYAEQATYIFSAAVRAPESDEPVGGIAIVFDATPQFRAMLDDVLPRQEDGSPVPGSFAVFTERSGRIIASTEGKLPVGSQLNLGNEFFNLDAGASYTNIVTFNERYYAVGSSMSAGYREYKSSPEAQRDGVLALVFWPLSEQVINPAHLPRQREVSYTAYARRQGSTEAGVDIACFHIGGNWYGIRSSQVIEAVDATRLTPMPGMPDHISGCVMHEDRAISVLDLSEKLGRRGPNGDRRRAADESGRPQIVIIGVPNRGLRFGILIDRLDAVCDIPAQHLEPLPEMMNEGQSLIEGLVKPLPESQERRILMVLSAERILERLQGAGALNESWIPPGLNAP